MKTYFLELNYYNIYEHIIRYIYSTMKTYEGTNKKHK